MPSRWLAPNPARPAWLTGVQGLEHDTGKRGGCSGAPASNWASNSSHPRPQGERPGRPAQAAPRAGEVADGGTPHLLHAARRRRIGRRPNTPSCIPSSTSERPEPPFSRAHSIAASPSGDPQHSNAGGRCVRQALGRAPAAGGGAQQQSQAAACRRRAGSKAARCAGGARRDWAAGEGCAPLGRPTPQPSRSPPPLPPAACPPTTRPALPGLQVIPALAGDATEQTPPDLPSYLFKERIVYVVRGQQLGGGGSGCTGGAAVPPLPRRCRARRARPCGAHMLRGTTCRKPGALNQVAGSLCAPRCMPPAHRRPAIPHLPLHPLSARACPWCRP